MQQCIQTLLIWLDSFANVYNLSVCLVSSLNFRLHIHNFCTVFLKITKEVSFIIASEASYNYILTEQKFMIIPKMDTNWLKMPILKNINGTFLVIFKHCESWGGWKVHPIWRDVEQFSKNSLFLLRRMGHTQCINCVVALFIQEENRRLMRQ